MGAKRKAAEMGAPQADQEELELQQAIELSMREFTASPPAPPARETPAKPPARGKRAAALAQSAAQPPEPARKEPAGQGQGQQRQQQGGQQPAPAPPPAKLQPARRPRGRKLAAFDPSPAEVEACFQALAEGGDAVTAASMQRVGGVLGQELHDAALLGMMRHAAEAVLGWASGAGRQQGRAGALRLAEFRALVEHFRVAAPAGRAG